MKKLIVLPVSDGCKIVEINAITRCQSSGAYTDIYLSDTAKILITKTLKEINDILKDYGFIRVHQSHLVNIKRICRYKKGKEGKIYMQDGAEIPVSQRKRKDINQYFDNLSVIHV